MSLIPDMGSLERKLDDSLAVMREILEQLKISNEWLEAISRNE